MAKSVASAQGTKRKGAAKHSSATVALVRGTTAVRSARSAAPADIVSFVEGAVHGRQIAKAPPSPIPLEIAIASAMSDILSSDAETARRFAFAFEMRSALSWLPEAGPDGMRNALGAALRMFGREESPTAATPSAPKSWKVPAALVSAIIGATRVPLPLGDVRAFVRKRGPNAKNLGDDLKQALLTYAVFAEEGLTADPW